MRPQPRRQNLIFKLAFSTLNFCFQLWSSARTHQIYRFRDFPFFRNLESEISSLISGPHVSLHKRLHAYIKSIFFVNIKPNTQHVKLKSWTIGLAIRCGPNVLNGRSRCDVICQTCDPISTAFSLIILHLALQGQPFTKSEISSQTSTLCNFVNPTSN